MAPRIPTTLSAPRPLKEPRQVQNGLAASLDLAMREQERRVGVIGALKKYVVLPQRTSTTHWISGAAASLESVVSNDVADSISVSATYVAS